MTKVAFNKKKIHHQQTGLKCKKKTSKVLHLDYSCVWYSNLDTSESKSVIPGVLKCGAGEGWRRSFALIMCEMNKCYKKIKRGISYQ